MEERYRGHAGTGRRERIEPPENFRKYAWISSGEAYRAFYQASLEDPEEFWGSVAAELHWFRPWNSVLEGQGPDAHWFSGGQTNLCYNALDRHAVGDRKNKTALIWEGEQGGVKVYTYGQLLQEVERFAGVLVRAGVGKGDRVAMYMPMIPEAVVAMLACVRIGAIHMVVFSGFSAGALAERVRDVGAVILITADGGWRKGRVLPLKANVDEALAGMESVKRVVVVRHTRQQVAMEPGRDRWYHELMREVDQPASPVSMASGAPLFVLYTSGSAGRPKGVVHTTGGYMTYVYFTSRLVFDLRPDDIFWCTADLGWIAGHSYTLYGPLLNGATTFIYEGAVSYPEPDRIWQMIDRHSISVLHTTPTLVRSLTKFGEAWLAKFSLASLRLLGSGGEAISAEAWYWYHRVVGRERCPVVDTWWQTETGGVMIATLPGAVAAWPGHTGLALPGVELALVDEDGKPVHGVNAEEQGYLTILRPWPGMLSTVWNDDERYRTEYWSRFPGQYFTGDGARRSKDGYLAIIGRVDDVLNVSGYRLGVMEIESALISHPLVAEAVVMGRPDPEKGESIVAFVTLIEGAEPMPDFKEELDRHVTGVIGSFARPDVLKLVNTLPKTRSGKVMRRLLRQMMGEDSGGGQSINGPLL